MPSSTALRVLLWLVGLVGVVGMMRTESAEWTEKAVRMAQAALENEALVPERTPLHLAVQQYKRLIAETAASPKGAAHHVALIATALYTYKCPSNTYSRGTGACDPCPVDRPSKRPTDDPYVPAEGGAESCDALCGADERSNGFGSCKACPEGETNMAGDDPNGPATLCDGSNCSTNFFSDGSGECQPCKAPPSQEDRARNDEAVAAAVEEEKAREREQARMGADAADDGTVGPNTGQAREEVRWYRAAGDDPSHFNSTYATQDPCKPPCDANFKSSGGGECVACPAGKYNRAGDDPFGRPTKCEFPQITWKDLSSRQQAAIADAVSTIVGLCKPGQTCSTLWRVQVGVTLVAVAAMLARFHLDGSLSMAIGQMAPSRGAGEGVSLFAVAGLAGPIAMALVEIFRSLEPGSGQSQGYTVKIIFAAVCAVVAYLDLLAQINTATFKARLLEKGSGWMVQERGMLAHAVLLLYMLLLAGGWLVLWGRMDIVGTHEVQFTLGVTGLVTVCLGALGWVIFLRWQDGRQVLFHKELVNGCYTHNGPIVYIRTPKHHDRPSGHMPPNVQRLKAIPRRLFPEEVPRIRINIMAFATVLATIATAVAVPISFKAETNIDTTVISLLLLLGVVAVTIGTFTVRLDSLCLLADDWLRADLVKKCCYEGADKHFADPDCIGQIQSMSPLEVKISLKLIYMPPPQKDIDELLKVMENGVVRDTRYVRDAIKPTQDDWRKGAFEECGTSVFGPGPQKR